MKLKLTIRVLTLFSKPEKLRECVLHSLSLCLFTFIGGRSSISELHSCAFLDSFWHPFGLAPWAAA